MNNLLNTIKINETDLPIIEYDGERVLNLKLIDQIHGRPEGTARKRFNDNKQYFIENEDFFSLSASEFRTLIWESFGFEPRSNSGTLLLEDGKIVSAPCKYSLKNGFSANLGSEKCQKTGDLNAQNAQTENKKSSKNSFSARYTSEKGQIIASFCGDDVQKDTLFIRLRRVYMYLARISIGQVKSQGNLSAAEYLLSLQEEWADALHDYETNGIAIKTSHIKQESSKIRDFLAVCKEKRMNDNPNERKVLSSMIKDMAEKIGHSYQNELFDE